MTLLATRKSRQLCKFAAAHCQVNEVEGNGKNQKDEILRITKTYD